MELNNELFDKILLDAISSPRKRMHYDLRTVAGKDTSQRMLNVLMPETVIPIHRHQETSETVIVCRGAVREVFYDAKGNKIDEFVLEAGGSCPGIQVPSRNVSYLYLSCSGSVIFEAKDRAYDPETTEDFLPVSLVPDIS